MNSLEKDEKESEQRVEMMDIEDEGSRYRLRSIFNSLKKTIVFEIEVLGTIKGPVPVAKGDKRRGEKISFNNSSHGEWVYLLLQNDHSGDFVTGPIVGIRSLI